MEPAYIGLLITVIVNAILIGKWIGTQNYLHKEIQTIHKDLEYFRHVIEDLKKENKADRHEFRKEVQAKMGEYWVDFNARFKTFEDRFEKRWENHK